MKLKSRLIFFIAFFSLGISVLSLAQEEPAERTDEVITPNVEYKAEGLRDPFQSYLEQRKTEELIAASPEAEVPLLTLTVQGIIWGGSFPQAIINDKVVKTEDTIDGARITNITKEGVSVLFEGRQYNLSSPAASTVKKP